MKDFGINTLASMSVINVSNFLFGGFDNLFNVLLVMLAVNIVIDIIVAYKDDKLTEEVALKILGIQLLNLLLIVVANLVDMSSIIDVLSLRTLVISYVLVTNVAKALKNLNALGVDVPSFLLVLVANKKDELDPPTNKDLETKDESEENEQEDFEGENEDAI